MDTASGTQVDGEGFLRVGGACLLNLMGCNFQVTILNVDGDLVQVTFPGRDYPIEAMHARFELHDNEGFDYYVATVVQGPAPEDEGIVLRQCGGLKRSLHRSSCRVPTDLTVRVKDQDHVRPYDAVLINLSAGGAFIRTEAPFDFSTTADLTLSLPGESTHTLPCQIVDVMPSMATANDSTHLICVRFLDIEPAVEESITRYIRWRLQELHRND